MIITDLMLIGGSSR